MIARTDRSAAMSAAALVNANVPRAGALPMPAAAQRAVAWLRSVLSASANLRTDSRAVQPGDGYLAYAVEGADNRPHIVDALARGAKAIVLQPAGEGRSSVDVSDAAVVANALDQDGVGAVQDAGGGTPALAVRDLDVLAGYIASGWYGTPSVALRVMGVTGTNGKTSTTQWIAAALADMSIRTAVIGTLGSGMPDKLQWTGFTTPNAAQFQQQLAQMRDERAVAVAVEVSSHALHQGRVNGTAFDIAVFTNLTQDHLDYHGTLEGYEAAKARLFNWPGLRAAVINADDAAGRRLLMQWPLPAGAAHQVHAPLVIAYLVDDAIEDDEAASAARAAIEHACAGAVGVLSAAALRATASGGTALTIRYEQRPSSPAVGAPSDSMPTNVARADDRAVAHGLLADRAALVHTAVIEVATMGAFNVSNLMAVLGAVLFATCDVAAGIDAVSFDAAVQSLVTLQPVLGRMQRLGGNPQRDEPLIVIDYAHTPDALDKTLRALRPVAAARGGALTVMFGCGGDRDNAKRPIMGGIAERLADHVVLTSDNPRTEVPASIIDQIAAGMSSDALQHRVRRIDDRASAILQTVRAAAQRDVVLLAGKGHEATQEVMGKKRPFQDQDHALLALATRATQMRSEARSESRGGEHGGDHGHGGQGERS
ncbi:UDP-N-acetylmuramoyl-L-alanyl-D-glutamate--2,6-diaminopimelate ligase [Robbsia andropogonis]